MAKKLKCNQFKERIINLEEIYHSNINILNKSKSYLIQLELIGF